MILVIPVAKQEVTRCLKRWFNYQTSFDIFLNVPNIILFMFHASILYDLSFSTYLRQALNCVQTLKYPACVLQQVKPSSFYAPIISQGTRWYTIVLLSVCLIHVNMLCWLYFALKKFSSNFTRFPVDFLMNFRLLFFQSFWIFFKEKIQSVVNMWFINLHIALTNTVQFHQIIQKDGLYTLVCDNFNFCQSKF